MDLLYKNQKDPRESAIQNIHFVQEHSRYSKDEEETVVSEYTEEVRRRPVIESVEDIRISDLECNRV